MPKPMLLKVTEVTQLLRLTRPKVYLLLELGILKGFRVGSDWRVRADSVDAVLAQELKAAA